MRFESYTKRNTRQGGFTLIEMIVALAIFSLTILVATNIYLLVSNTQQRALAAQKILDDVRALFETMTQEVRLGTINYTYYEDQGIDLHPEATTPVTILAIHSQSGSDIFFQFQSSSNTVQYCEEVTGTDCDPSGSGWLDVTPAGVTIDRLAFEITPSADPYSEVSAVSCAVGGNAVCDNAGLVSYRCAADNVCRYYSNGRTVQPQVLISFASTALAPRLIQQASVSMQTIVTSRIIQQSLVNEYHD